MCPFKRRNSYHRKPLVSLFHYSITKLYLLADTHQWPRLGSSEVFAQSFTLDYTMYGGVSTQSTPDGFLGMWRPLVERLGSTHRLQTSLLIEKLADPSSGHPGTDGQVVFLGSVKTAKVTSYMTVHIPKDMRRMANGGMNTFELVKLSVDECKTAYGESWDGNPWRVSSMNVVPRWEEGDTEILRE